MSKSTHPLQPHQERVHSKPLSLLIPLLLVLAAAIIYQLETFDPAHLPTHEFTPHPIPVPNTNPSLLSGSERVGSGHLLGPEDIVYDAHSGVVYTGCMDGWVKRVESDLVVDWVNTGGRPLGLALGPSRQLIIADADEGLLKVTTDGEIEVLTKEAEGVEFKLTDGVDVAEDGVIYFTDASYKYTLKEFIWDFLEGRPHGRLLSYNPSTKGTKVLLSNLYFPNGVAISPDQNSIVFCETPMYGITVSDVWHLCKHPQFC